MSNNAQFRDVYFPQLDGLRAIAVGLVIVFHWLPDRQGVNMIANGPLGVTLFFVLSGFLITRILLENKVDIEEEGIFSLYRAFMTRRILRIFPIYYLVLICIWFLQYNTFIDPIETQLYTHPAYYLFYGSNFLIDKFSNWADVLSIYWTLAVEEQFYIFWPLIIWKVPNRFLKTVVIGVIFLALLTRGVLFFLENNAGVLVPTCLDSFGMGALWAIILAEDKAAEKFVRNIRWWAVYGALVFFILCTADQRSLFEALFFRTGASIFCLYLVAKASYGTGFKSYFGRFIENRFIRYVGKISYGIYMYHMLIPYLIVPLMIKLFRRLFHVEVRLTEQSNIILSLFLLVGVAALSWYFVEKPFIRLKKRFQVSRVKPGYVEMTS
ncbi:acyltransferase family protein [Dyadobacter pollutisoli]|jgi:peptidoglycan/LPS O-acetylase OafA/YrhL|uniref:Acyltransferase n=1 Tax=Dyadobacter pollutisoli TaxID=2910158 RepID=A0A9E8SPS2_9BACT|nr:acyltransferase [Dyadobacter pollutisoli]WAC12212.1 acyltransferase [Dyadobacter pollutisoli]